MPLHIAQALNIYYLIQFNFHAICAMCNNGNNKNNDSCCDAIRRPQYSDKKKKCIGSFSALFHENVQAVFSPHSPTFSPCESCCVGQCNVIITRDYGISTIIINEDMCVYGTANSRSTHAIHMQRCKF